MTDHALLLRRNRIGAHCWGTDAQSVAALPDMAAAGCRWLRATRQVQMDTVLVEPGVYDWAKGGEHSVDQALAQGMAIMGILDGRWGNETGDNVLDWSSPVWEHLDAWCDFVRQAVRHYRGRIRTWEVLNEPPFFWWHPPAHRTEFACPGPHMQRAPIRRYTELLIATSRVIRAEDPDAVIVCGAGFPDGSFLERLYACGGKGHFDVVGVHYLSARHPEDWRRGMARLRAVMAAHGDADRAIWDTENGPHGAVIGHAVSTPQDYEAIYNVYRHCFAYETGLDRYFWFNAFWNTPKPGDPAPIATPPYRALQVLTAQLGEGDLLAHHHPAPEIHAYVFAGPRGPVTVLWSTAPAQVRLAEPAAAITYLGDHRAVSGDLELDGRPLYLPGDIVAAGMTVLRCGLRETVIPCAESKVPNAATPTSVSTRLTGAPDWAALPVTVPAATMDVTPPGGAVSAVCTPLAGDLIVAHDDQHLYLHIALETDVDEGLVQFALNDRDPATAEWPFFINGSCLFNLRIHGGRVIASRFECVDPGLTPAGVVADLPVTAVRQGAHLVLTAAIPWAVLGRLRPGRHQPFFAQFTCSRHDELLRLRPGDQPEEWSHNFADVFIVRRASHACYLRCD